MVGSIPAINHYHHYVLYTQSMYIACLKTYIRAIEPFQQGETPTFTRHVKAGLQAAADDPKSVLLFSGYEF